VQWNDFFSVSCKFYVQATSIKILIVQIYSLASPAFMSPIISREGRKRGRSMTRLSADTVAFNSLPQALDFSEWRFPGAPLISQSGVIAIMEGAGSGTSGHPIVLEQSASGMLDGDEVYGSSHLFW
jgi:hypothetical protein